MSVVRTCRYFVPAALVGLGFLGAMSLCSASVAAPLEDEAPARTVHEAVDRQFTPHNWEGFRLAAGEEGAELRVGSLVQTDMILRLADDHAPETLLQVRRARIVLRGSLSSRIEFKLQPQFTPGSIHLLDGYLDLRLASWLFLRVGKAKSPLGIEMLQPAASLLLPERGRSTALVPNRDIGVLARGEFGRGLVSTTLGAGTGAADQVRPERNTDDWLDLYGRLVLRPFTRTGVVPLRTLALGLAGSWGRTAGSTEDPGLGRYRTGTGLTFARYADGVTADGDRWRLNPQLTWLWGPFGMLGEYVQEHQEVRFGESPRTLVNRAWSLAGVFFLTQEKATLRGPTLNHSWGAVDVAARYGELRLDSEAAEGGVFAQGVAPVARSWGVGISYWPHAAVRTQVAFELTRFEGPDGAAMEPENALFLRLQLAL